MITRVQSFTFAGIEAIPVTVEAHISAGIPSFIVVGLADKAVGEARERVRCAFASLGLALPPKRILVNLVPADIPKEGSHFDLPIALALLCGMGVIPSDALEQCAALGELSLDGHINPVSGALSAAICAAEKALSLICPAAQGQEAQWASEELPVYAAADLSQIIAHFQGRQVLSAPAPLTLHPPAPEPDLADVKGMSVGRRTLEIAAAGGHSLLMIGPPGAGKSMLAARMTSIMPDLDRHQILQVSRIYSLSGLLKDGQLITRPPFRDPHHSLSLPALAGGGARARPGEVSLAQHGILFLDELPEFSRACLEALRQPIETGTITVARAAHHVTYPAHFQLVAAMNPCRCGYLGDADRQCRKAPRCAEDYTARISGPLMDRMDLAVFLKPATPVELTRAVKGEASAVVRQRVENARARQMARQGVINARADFEELSLTNGARSQLEEIGTKLRLSARAMTRLVRVGRTLADLAGSPSLEPAHLMEALAFRHR
ncbi:MCM domain-containing protein [Acetobacteraceae bacterium EV16G]|uniref:MCM domain-containing protein n=1 Tax=Sorlinia euscelidii TaxID=3081148 RepID=A0ABU7U4Z4_9PROT